MEIFSNFTYQDIKNELFRLKGKEMKTNFFISEFLFNILVSEEKIQVFKTEKGCYLLVEDNDFQRFYFIVVNVEELNIGFKEIFSNHPNIVTAEVVGNSKYLEPLQNVFSENGFFNYTSMVRMSKVRKPNESVDFINIHLLEADKKTELLNLFSKYFDKFVERIPKSEEVDQFIENKNIYYFSDNDEIQGFIIFENHGLTAHLRYWFVHPEYREKKIGSKLIQLFFTEYKEVKRELFWVIASNENAIKRYKHFGFVEEDMHNLILINKNLKYED